MFNLSAEVQIEARTLWDLVVADTCGCYDIDKPCNKLISEGTYGSEELPCGYACENNGTICLFQMLLRNKELLKTMYPVFWKKTTLKREIDLVLSRLHAWDPNGDWDIYDVLVTPWQTVRTLENLKADLQDNYEDIPGWIDACIDYLMVLALE